MVERPEPPLPPAIGHSLDELEATLRMVAPDRVRTPSGTGRRSPSPIGPIWIILSWARDAGGRQLPRAAPGLHRSRFRVKAAGPARGRPTTSGGTPRSRADFGDFLATYLTTPEAARAPMLLLGQPGAGKSALTRILAARLPAADFLVVRVVLREVPAEAEVQDQIEHALRSAIGETVAWADLARDAGGALPVILLDGFDELLQATGMHQSDYLQRVAASSAGRPTWAARSRCW